MFLTLESQVGVKVLVKIKFGLECDNQLDRNIKESVKERTAMRRGREL